MADLNEIIEKAQGLSGAPRNTRAVVRQLLHGKLWDELVADPIVHRIVMRAGLDLRVGAFIKQLRKAIDDHDSAPASEPMLALWPESVRALVKDIDRAAVFVPSVGEFVDMLPDEITPAQADEAAAHLENHAEDAMRRATLLRQLARIGW